MLSSNFVVFPNVKIGNNCIIEDYVVIGIPPKGYEPGELETIIGDNAVIRSHTVIYAGNKIGNNFQTGNKANIREQNEIGDDVSIGTLSVVEHHVKIGDGVRIHTQVFVPEFTVLEKLCWLGPNAVLTNAKYPKSPSAKTTLNGPHIKQSAIIGANATLLPGVTVGEDAIVGAGSVVTKDIPARCVVAGNPAVIINSIDNLPYEKRDT
jgi:acetyltransferase-like isoleucine patch superfamily enzyme